MPTGGCARNACSVLFANSTQPVEPVVIARRMPIGIHVAVRFDNHKFGGALRERLMKRIPLLLLAVLFVSVSLLNRVSFSQTSGGGDSKPAKNESAFPFDRDTEKIVRELDSARKAATENLTDHFEIALKRLETSKLRAEQILALRDALRKEQERFKEHGLIPFSELMLTASVEFLQKSAEADSRAKTKYSQLILKLGKKLDSSQLTELKHRQKSALKPTLVAKWNHQTGGNPLAEVELLSNGRIGSADSLNHWTLNANGNIQLRWPSSNAPDGVWIDSCQLTADGMEFRGKNQHNAATFGKLITK